MGYTFHDPDTLPDPFDVVWCKFPHRGDKLRPSNVARPVLVLDSKRLSSEEQEIGVVVVQYGGSYEAKHIPQNLLITEMDSGALGLHKSTLFRMDLGNRARLMWCEEYFVPQSYVVGSGIKAGSLNEEQKDRALTCLKQRGLSFPVPEPKPAT
jgi:hypothetical protein